MRRLVIGIAAGALALALMAPGALAGAPPREDALGDVAQSKGDIVTGTYTASFLDSFLTRVKARVTLRQGTNPLIAGGWRSPATGLTMQLDTTNTHTGPDLSVVLRAVDDGGVTFVADVTDLVAGEPVPCSATATFTAPNVYKANLPSDCLPGSVTSVRGRFRMRWDQPPAGGSVTLDKSPNTRWGPTLHAVPTVTVSRGSSAAGQRGCSVPGCSFLRISYSNFSGGNHSYSCRSVNGGAFYDGTNWRNGSRVSSSSGGGELWCYAAASFYGGVYVVLDGVRSNTANW